MINEPKHSTAIVFNYPESERNEVIEMLRLWMMDEKITIEISGQRYDLKAKLIRWESTSDCKLFIGPSAEGIPSKYMVYGEVNTLKDGRK